MEITEIGNRPIIRQTHKTLFECFIDNEQISKLRVV